MHAALPDMGGDADMELRTPQDKVRFSKIDATTKNDDDDAKKTRDSFPNSGATAAEEVEELNYKHYRSMRLIIGETGDKIDNGKIYETTVKRMLETETGFAKQIATAAPLQIGVDKKTSQIVEVGWWQESEVCDEGNEWMAEVGHEFIEVEVDEQPWVTFIMMADKDMLVGAMILGTEVSS